MIDRRLHVLPALLAWGSAFAQPAVPETVSPGSAESTDVVASICPTFNWGHVADVDRYEIAVHREAASSADPLFVRAVPGTASGWTPSLERCFTPGERYAWRVRAVGSTGASDWSATSRFVVAPGAASSPAAPKGATAQLEVAGGVLATTFAGEGSALTNVDAATLDGIDGTGFATSGQSCAAGFYVRGIDATGAVVCAALAEYVNQSCHLFLGSRDACNGCTTIPAKWGRTSANACDAGVGADNTCQTSTLGADSVTLFGLNFDGDVDENDKLYVGLKCL